MGFINVCVGFIIFGVREFKVLNKFDGNLILFGEVKDSLGLGNKMIDFKIDVL